MKEYIEKYKYLLVLAKSANGRKETIGLLNEAAKIHSRLISKNERFLFSKSLM